MNMNKESIPELGDFESFQQSISHLQRGLMTSWLITIGEVLIVVSVLAAPVFFAKLSGARGPATLSTYAFLVVLLACNGCRFFQHRRLNKVHSDLTAQLGISIRQRRRADKLYSLSILDPLTGLHNRRFGEERLQEEIRRAEENNDPLAVIILDLDHFKQINDQFGHAAGDAALKSFSLSLQRAIRACDVAVRIGGDEFLVVLPDCPREKVDVILARLGSPQLQINFEMNPICYSVGRAHYQFSDTIKTLLKRADEALYAQKQARPKLTRPPSQTWNGNVTSGGTDDPRSADKYGGLHVDLGNSSFVS
jgi:diguanylate cyclase (GGDEF)-like protein